MPKSFRDDDKLPYSTEESPLVATSELRPRTRHHFMLWMISSNLRYVRVSLLALLLLFSMLLYTMFSAPDGSAELLGEALSMMTSIKVAFAGNSMMYYQDLPRLLQQMLETKFDNVFQDSCFQGLSSISSLWTIGNTVNDTFHTDSARLSDGTYDIGAPTIQSLLNETDWNFLVMNDFTQGPARVKSREESKRALRKYYAPLLRDKRTTLILLETAAYEIPSIQNTKDLGDFDEFTKLLHEGYLDYLLWMQKLNVSTRLAPNGLAFSYVKYHKPELYNMLYAPDHHHPSPHGTWMEACVVYCTMFGEMPPRYNVSWWKKARYCVEGLSFPTDGEAEQIRQVSGYVCQL
jgi:fumarate reductase subunit D